jgi:hypothetical protein
VVSAASGPFPRSCPGIPPPLLGEPGGVPKRRAETFQHYQDWLAGLDLVGEASPYLAFAACDSSVRGRVAHPLDPEVREPRLRERRRRRKIRDDDLRSRGDPPRPASLLPLAFDPVLRIGDDGGEPEHAGGPWRTRRSRPLPRSSAVRVAGSRIPPSHRGPPFRQARTEEAGRLRSHPASTSTSPHHEDKRCRDGRIASTTSSPSGHIQAVADRLAEATGARPSATKPRGWRVGVRCSHVDHSRTGRRARIRALGR